MNGRPRKAKINQVVKIKQNILGHHEYAVVVGYRASPSPRYQVIRTDPIGRYPYGPAIWIESTEFSPTWRWSRTPGIIHRKNEKLALTWGKRPCYCQCCEH